MITTFRVNYGCGWRCYYWRFYSLLEGKAGYWIRHLYWCISKMSWLEVWMAIWKDSYPEGKVCRCGSNNYLDAFSVLEYSNVELLVEFLYCEAMHLSFHLFASWVYSVGFQKWEDTVWFGWLENQISLKTNVLSVVSCVTNCHVGISGNYYCAFDGRYDKRTSVGSFKTY